MNGDLAWAAGFIDGDGSIAIARDWPSRRMVNPHHSLFVRVGNTDLAVLEELQRIFGVGSIFQQDKRKHPDSYNHLPFYSWTVRSLQAAKILVGVFPFLRVKKRQAEEALDFAVLSGTAIKSSPKGVSREENGRGQLSDEDVAMRDAYYWRLRELKR